MSYILVFGLMSPTLFFADLLKQNCNRSRVIRFLNTIYFLISIVSVISILIWQELKSIYRIDFEIYNTVVILWVLFLLSRCSEIFVAFLRDAYDKVAGKSTKERKEFPWPKRLIILKNKATEFKYPKSWFCGDGIKNHDRLVLSFKSYFELLINFSIIYHLLPYEYWKDSCSQLSLVDSLYFSGVTITTLGYGDISPIHWFPKFLTVFEVLCGFSLIVVCFAVYLKDDTSVKSLESQLSAETEVCKSANNESSKDTNSNTDIPTSIKNTSEEDSNGDVKPKSPPKNVS